MQFWNCGSLIYLLSVLVTIFHSQINPGHCDDFRSSSNHTQLALLNERISELEETLTQKEIFWNGSIIQLVKKLGKFSRNLEIVKIKYEKEKASHNFCQKYGSELLRLPLSSFPYGVSHGDLKLPPTDDRIFNVSFPFNYFGKFYKNAMINSNGAIHFQKVVSLRERCESSSAYPMVAIFWSDIDTTKEGEIFYRISTQKSDLLVAKSWLSRTAHANVSLSRLLILTFDKVPPSSNICQENSLPRNTFQAVLATDDLSKSFVLFDYHELGWRSPKFNAECYPEKIGEEAQAKLVSGFEPGTILLPGSCEPQVQNLTSKTNIDSAGKFLFLVNP